MRLKLTNAIIAKHDRDRKEDAEKQDQAAIRRRRFGGGKCGLEHPKLLTQLTALEFKLLYHLASNPDETYDRAKIQEMVWGANRRNTERAVDVLVNRLRSRLEQLPGGDKIVKTVRGIGYRFRP